MPLTDNLISYYKLEGNSNDELAAHNGTDTSITYSVANGKIGQGAGFNGTSSKILTSGNSAISGDAAFSYSVWINTNSITDTAYQVPVSVGNFLNTLEAAGMFMNVGTGTIGLNFSGGNNYISATNALAINTWYHIVTTKTAGAINTTTKLYVNNVDTAAVSPSTNTPNIVNAPIRIGHAIDGATDKYFMDGEIDEVGVWSRALTASEVSQLYNNGAGLTYPFTGAVISNLLTLRVG